MVKATTDSSSSLLQMGRGGKARAARGRPQRGFFAAILEKALNGPAAPEKTGRVKPAAFSPRLKFPQMGQTDRAKEGVEKLRVDGEPERGKLRGPRRRETRESGARERAVPFVPADVPREALVPVKKELPRAAENAVQESRPAAAPPVLPSRSVLMTEAAREARGGVLQAAAAQTAGFGEGPKLPVEKVKSAGGEKRLSVKQKDAAAARKPGRESGSLAKTEKTDPGLVTREVKSARADEPRKEEVQNIEIRVFTRAGDERLEDSIRLVDDRSVRESASGLVRRMREEGNEQIVKNARIILRDKNEGEIRLILKPESLGEVRIQLSMQDNLIEGRIFVENDSVREAFEQNMPGLASAFRESGLELGSLNVSVGNDRYEEGASGEKRSGAGISSGGVEKETALPAAELFEYYFFPHSINLMV